MCTYKKENCNETDISHRYHAMLKKIVKYNITEIYHADERRTE